MTIIETKSQKLFIDFIKSVNISLRKSISTNINFTNLKNEIQITPKDILVLFNIAAGRSYFKIIEILMELINSAFPEYLISKIKDIIILNEDNKVFQQAVDSGNIKMVRLLLALISDEKREEMIYSRDNNAFRTAVEQGYLEIVEVILEFSLDCDKKIKMIHSRYDYAFCYVAKNGNIEILARIAYEINDADKIKRIFNNLDNIHDDIKPYKENSSKLIELGNLYHDLPIIAKAMTPYTLVSKEFLENFEDQTKSTKLDQYVIAKIMNLITHNLGNGDNKNKIRINDNQINKTLNILKTDAKNLIIDKRKTKAIKLTKREGKLLFIDRINKNIANKVRIER